MRNYLTVVRKELYTLFSSFIAYCVLAVFFAVSGYFFYIILANIIDQVMRMAFQSQQFGSSPPPVDVPAIVARNFFGVVSTILLFFIPAITMGVIAEEKKRGTIELLFTSPVTNLQLVLGKFSAVFLFLILMLVPIVLDLLLLCFYSEPAQPLAPLMIGFLGVVLLGAALLSFGIFVSSLTENQIVAFVSTFGVFIILWVIDAAAGTGSTLSNEIMRYLSILNHYEDFTKGVLDTVHVLFYLSFVFLGLFLTSISLGSSRWRK